MANSIYPKYKEAILSGSANVSLTGGVVKAVLVDTGTYTYSAAHDFYDDVTGAVGTPATIGSVTVTNGLFDGADAILTAVSGSSAEAVIVFIDTGTPSTSRLVAYYDTGMTGMPVTPNGGDITVTFNASGIIQF